MSGLNYGPEFQLVENAQRADATTINGSGGLSTGIAYLLWNLAVHHVGPSQTAIFSNLVPFVALLAAFVLLGDPITLLQLAGGVLIIGGLVLMRRA